MGDGEEGGVVRKCGVRNAEWGTAAGGSARPWGLVLPEVRAKEVEGDWEPEVRVAALGH